MKQNLNTAKQHNVYCVRILESNHSAKSDKLSGSILIF